MAVNPHFDIDFSSKKCVCCGQMKDSFSFLRTKSFMYPTGYVDVCVDCLGDKLKESGMDWNVMDKLLKSYNLIYFGDEYEHIDWSSYQEAYKELDAAGALDEVIPGLSDDKRRKLLDKWGGNYDDEALNYLENLNDYCMNFLYLLNL